MLELDHLTVVAPTLAEGVDHVRSCLDLDVPPGQRHIYMGTHNCLLRLGETVYLEIVALDPEGQAPPRTRWFGLDDQKSVRADWEAGCRLRGWVARTNVIDRVLAGRESIFGAKISLPWDSPTFVFAIPEDGSLPLGGAAPSIIDRQGKPRSMDTIVDMGAKLRSFSLEHPDEAAIAALYRELSIDRPPEIARGNSLRYRALVETSNGAKELS